MQHIEKNHPETGITPDRLYWPATVVLLIGVVAHVEQAYAAVLALTAVQIVHYVARERSAAAFPVQVRAAYCGLLIAGTLPYLGFVHWVQLVGTTAVVTVDYCFLARCMSLLPWNRKEPMSWALVGQTFFSPPVRGSVLQEQPKVV